MKTVWGETVRRRSRNKRNVAILTSHILYSITETGEDCAIIGHTLNFWSLAGTTTRMDCGKSIFCPQRIQKHPNDPQAEALVCEQHEERTDHHAG